MAAGVIAQSHGAECKLHFYLQQRRRGHEGVNIVSISITTAQCPAAAGVAPAPVNRGDSHFHPPTLASHQPGRVATLGLGWAGLAGLGWAVLGWAGSGITRARRNNHHDEPFTCIMCCKVTAGEVQGRDHPPPAYPAPSTQLHRTRMDSV